MKSQFFYSLIIDELKFYLMLIKQKKKKNCSQNPFKPKNIATRDELKSYLLAASLSEFQLHPEQNQRVQKIKRKVNNFYKSNGKCSHRILSTLLSQDNGITFRNSSNQGKCLTKRHATSIERQQQEVKIMFTDSVSEAKFKSIRYSLRKRYERMKSKKAFSITIEDFENAKIFKKAEKQSVRNSSTGDKEFHHMTTPTNMMIKSHKRCKS